MVNGSLIKGCRPKKPSSTLSQIGRGGVCFAIYK